MVINPENSKELAADILGETSSTSKDNNSFLLDERLINSVVSAGKALNSDLVFLFFLDESKREVTAYFSVNSPDEPPWQKTQWKVSEEVGSLISNPAAGWEREISRQLVPKIAKRKAASLSVRQIVVSNKNLGFFGIATFKSRLFNQSELAMINLAADNILSLWENDELKKTSQQLGKEMDSLIRFSRYFSAHAGEVELVLEKVLNELKTIIDVENCGVLLYDQDKQELVLQKPAFGVNDEKFKAYSLSTKTEKEEGIGVATKVFLSGEPYICNVIDEDHFTNRKLAEIYGVRNSLTVPLVVDNRRIGVLHTINKKQGIFTDNDTRLVQLLAYQIAKLIENVRLFGQVESKNSLLRHSMDIHSQLTKLVLKDKNLDEIIFRLAQLIDRNVIVQDQFFKVLGTSFQADAQKLTMIEKAMAEDLWENTQYKKLITQVNKFKQPVLLPSYPDEGLSCAMLIAPITLANNILGYVSIQQDDKGNLGEEHFLAIEHAVTAFTLKMMQQKTAYEVEERIKGDFLDDLLNGNYRSTKDIAQRAVYLGHDLREPYQVMVIDIDNFSDYVKKQGGNEHLLSKLKRRVFEVVRNSLDQQLGSCMVGTRSDTIVVIAPFSGKKQLAKPPEVADYIRLRVNQLIADITVSVGIGRVTNSIEDIEVSYQEARRAITIGKKFNKKDQIIKYDSLGAYKILFIAQQEEQLQTFAVQTLGAILEYDQEKNLNLIHTLSSYLEHNCNNQKTAESLFIHLNTLKYRLQKIQDLAGVDLNNPEERLSLQLAIKVLEIKNI